MSYLRLVVRPMDRDLHVELHDGLGVTAGTIRAVTLGGWHDQVYVMHAAAAAGATAGLRTVPLDSAQLEMGRLTWKELPGVAEVLRGAIRSGSITVGLEIAADNAMATGLHLLPWELLPFPDRDERFDQPLIGEGCEFVRMLPPATHVPHTAGVLREVGGDVMLQFGVFASPLFNSGTGSSALEAFNAGAIAARLAASSGLGMLGPGSIEHRFDADWKQFTDPRCAIRLFFGHGTPLRNTDATLALFRSHAGDWLRQDVKSAQLRGLLEAGDTNMLGLIACHGYRCVAAALGSVKVTPPWVISALSAVPIEYMEGAWLAGLRTLATQNDGLAFLRAMRRFLSERAPGFERAIVGFHQPDDHLSPRPRFDLIAGLRCRVDLARVGTIGWTADERARILANKALGCTRVNWPFRPRVPAPRGEILVATYPVTQWQASLILPGRTCPAGDELLPAQLTASEAQACLQRIGGGARLPTADEYECCVSLIVVDGVERRVDADLVWLSRTAGRYQVLRGGAWHGPQQAPTVVDPSGPRNVHGLRHSLGGSPEWVAEDAIPQLLGGSWQVGVGDCLPAWRAGAAGQAQTGVLRPVWGG